MSFRSTQDEPFQSIAEINTTPLVDVMLVLLVIFILTAPLFNPGIPVDLPRTQAKPLDEPPRVVQLALDAEGRLYIDGETVAPEALTQRLGATIVAGRPLPEVHLRADRGTRYERVTDAMAAAQRAGLTKIAFVTSPPK